MLVCLILANVCPDVDAQQSGLAGHWKLRSDLRDSSSHGNAANNHGAVFPAEENGAAQFDGVKSYIEIPHSASLALGREDFSLSLWVFTAEKMDDNPGDLISKYDPKTRRGFNLSLFNHAGATGSQANYRNIQFGIDNGRQSAEWRDEGHPGKSVFIHSMAVHDGDLYVGTVEGRTNNDKGHVYRYKKTGEWEDLGAPWKSNGVTSMASFQGRLHVGVSRVLLHYSGLEPTLSHHIGGKVFRLEDDGQWTDLGQLLGLDGVNGLVNFKGDLYATGFYQPAFFRYEGGTKWRSMGTPGDLRTEAMAVHNGSIYATSYDEGSVFRFDGKGWHHTGLLGTASHGFPPAWMGIRPAHRSTALDTTGENSSREPGLRARSTGTRAGRIGSPPVASVRNRRSCRPITTTANCTPGLCRWLRFSDMTAVKNGSPWGAWTSPRR
jgi:hypothetical protein